MWSPEGVEKEKSATRAGKCSIFILTLYLPAGIYICQCPRILLSVNVNMLSAKSPSSINIKLLMWEEFQVDVSLIVNWIPRIASRKTLLNNEAKESTYRNGPTDRSLLFIICETFLDDTNMSFSNYCQEFNGSNGKVILSVESFHADNVCHCFPAESGNKWS